MRILVTGIGGFIGGSVYRALLNKYPDAEIVGTTHVARFGYEDHPDRDKPGAIKIECDLEKRAWVDRLLSTFLPDIIVHISGIGTQDSPSHALFNSHVTSTLNLLAGIKQETKPLFIHLSSIVAGIKPLNFYGACKLSAESFVKAYNDMGIVKGVSVRPCAILGGRYHGLLPDLLRKLLDDKETYLNLRANSCKPFIFIDVFTDFILKLIENEAWQERSPITISSSDTITVEDIAEIAMNKTGVHKPIRWAGELFKGDQQKVNSFSSISYQDFYFGSALVNVNSGLEYMLKNYYGVKND